MGQTTRSFAEISDLATPHRWWRRSRRTARAAGRSAQPLTAAIEALEPRRLMTAITGVVYADTNGNGTQDTGEPGVPGIEVTYDGSNNTSTASDGTFTVSGAAGSGSHYVGITVPAGWTLTEPTGAGTYLNTGSDASLSFGVQFTPNLFASAPSGSEVDLSWSNADSALHAVIQRSSDSGSTWTTPTPLSSGATTYADTDPALTPGTWYEYNLTMEDSSGTPIASATQSVMTTYGTLATIHDAPMNISTYGLGGLGVVPWSSWNSASMLTGTTTAGGSVTANEDGSWTYTPPPGWVGKDTLMYTLTNDTTTSAPLPLTIKVTDQAPQVWSTWGDAVNTDATDPGNAAPPVSGSLEATDGDGDDLTFHLVNADGSAATADESGNVATNHGTVTLASNGNYTYTPAEGFVGVDRFYFLANDGIENGNVGTVTIDIDAGIPLLSVDGIGSAMTIGLPFTFFITGGNYQNVDLSQFEVLSGPSHGSLVVNGDGSLTYTAGSDGLDSFTFDYGPNVPPSTALLDVNTGWDPTWGGVGGALYTVKHGDTLTEPAAGGLLTWVDYAPGGTLSVSMVSGPSSGTLTLGTNEDDVQDGSFTYTPAADTTGWVYFTYQVHADGATSPVATGAINVTDWINMESRFPVNLSTTPGTAVSFDPRTPFVDTEHPLDSLTTFIPTGLGPQNGSVTVNEDGTLTYTPTTGFVGSDSFTYQITDGVTDAEFGSISSQTDSLNSGYSTVYIVYS